MVFIRFKCLIHSFLSKLQTPNFKAFAYFIYGQTIPTPKTLCKSFFFVLMEYIHNSFLKNKTFIYHLHNNRWKCVVKKINPNHNQIYFCVLPIPWNYSILVLQSKSVLLIHIIRWLELITSEIFYHSQTFKPSSWLYRILLIEKIVIISFNAQKVSKLYHIYLKLVC